MFSRACLILVVDDEMRLRTMIAELLEGQGCQVLVAGSGDEAMELVHCRPDIELILTDVRMPGRLDGFDLVEQALAARPGVRTIVMSGYTGEAAGRATVADRFMAKPFTMVSLETEVQRLLAA